MDDSRSNRDKVYLDHLSELASDPNLRVFAVMDGAFFQNVSADLRDASLTSRALYFHSGNQAVVIGGPWLINPYQHNTAVDPQPPAWTAISEEERTSGKSDSEIYADRMQAALDAGDETGGGMLSVDDVENVSATIARLEAILRIADGKPGLVFWIGDASLTEDILFSHLRRLNRILVPNDSIGDEATDELLEAAADAEEILVAKQNDAYELVVFRHADANVMAQVFPALNEVQAARLFGPCHQLLFAPDPDWSGGIKRARRPNDLPAPPSGPLRWEPETIRAIKAQRMEASRRKVMSYLREVDPDAEELSDAELRHRVLIYEASGNTLGLQSERAHMKWAYLMSITDGKADSDGIAKAYFQKNSKHPDDAIDDVLDTLGDHWDRLWQGATR
ncbi:hypothetical protein FY136_21785 [Agrobacterium tumefaciens]|uniref:hypothetical protein n=1 Tax=Agrobacterium tumefaciens TaxID=358 RepID=UPI0021D0F0A8|nr:hypothetical protein [Agrobacterium tumefaciens]UXT51854.1 hypothetical protein FY136_21785 [Agrobacterium tumefaciens]